MASRIKICGITDANDAQQAVRLGAWALGFVFYKKSPRFIGPYKAAKIIKSLPPFVTPVGVFVNQKEGAVREIAEFCRLPVLQFHGEEPPVYCERFKKFKVIKAFGVAGEFGTNVLKDYKVSAFLFDAHHPQAHGGTGQTFDWALLKRVRDFACPVILSGGLNPQNVGRAISEVAPYAVDVSSGVESSPGRKDERLLRDFFQQANLS